MKYRCRFEYRVTEYVDVEADSKESALALAEADAEDIAKTNLLLHEATAREVK
jgi:hypothetical protein